MIKCVHEVALCVHEVNDELLISMTSAGHTITVCLDLAGQLGDDLIAAVAELQADDAVTQTKTTIEATRPARPRNEVGFAKYPPYPHRPT